MAPGGAEVVDARGLCLAPGLVDMRVQLGEPGAEHKERIETATAAAAAGGITSLAVLPEHRIRRSTIRRWSSSWPGAPGR